MPRTRRNFTAEFKAKVVSEIVSGSKSAAEVCRDCSLKPDLVSRSTEVRRILHTIVGFFPWSSG